MVDELIEKLSTELKLRGFTERTVGNYCYQTKKFIQYINKDARQINVDDVKRYMAHLLSDKQCKSSSVNLFLSAVKFFFKELMSKDFSGIKALKQEKTLPTVVSKEELKKILDATENIKHKLLIKFMYSAGLRVSECVKVKVDELDLDQKMGTIRCGKGRKDRLIILSEKLIEELRVYLASRKNNSEFVFNVKEKHLSIRQAQQIVKDAKVKAGIKRRVYCHALRSSFATHLLEEGTDIRVIQELLGHSNLATTERYTRVSSEQLKKVVSPLDTMV
jgi:integrase/recombinase XerD